MNVSSFSPNKYSALETFTTENISIADKPLLINDKTSNPHSRRLTNSSSVSGESRVESEYTESLAEQRLVKGRL